MATSALTLTHPEIVTCLELLERENLPVQSLLKMTDRQLEMLSPAPLTPLQVVKLQIALDKKKGDEIIASLYRKVLRFVGRLEVHFPSEEVKYGSCILVGEEGFVVTAYHVLTCYEETRTNWRQKKKVQKAIEKPKIMVHLPNTSKGSIQFQASVCHLSPKEDLALLKPIDDVTSLLAGVQCLLQWPRFDPEEGQEVMCLSFPPGKGEDQPIVHKPTPSEELPWCSKGVVSCVDSYKGVAYADYSSFGGCSGGLVVCSKGFDGFVPYIHLGTYHETEALNTGLGEKGHNAYFSLIVGPFFQQFFHQPSRMPARFHHQDVKRVRKTIATQQAKLKKHRKLVEFIEEVAENSVEAVETLDLFGPWPGLDDE